MSVFDFNAAPAADGFQGVASLANATSVTVVLPVQVDGAAYHVTVTARDVSCPGLYVANQTESTFDIKNPTPATVDVAWVLRFA